ncbi:MAG: VOC family protein [Pseudomonadota bacterium]
MLEQVCPILPSRDFATTSAFYKRLGFHEALRVAHQYLIMNRDAVELHFFPHPQLQPKDNAHGAYVRPADVDAISAEWSALDLPHDTGFPRFLPAEDKPWGMREATVWDPDGSLLRIGTEI